VLAAVLVPLSILARQNPLTNGGESLVVLPFGAVGFVVARRRAGNPIGWLLLTVTACFLLSNDSEFYAADVYRLGHHLPLGPAAVVLYELWGPALGAQVLNWRRSAGERRQQMKWLASGAVLAVICLILGLLLSGSAVRRSLEPAHVSVWASQRG
jgi:hypothetical protein